MDYSHNRNHRHNDRYRHHRNRHRNQQQHGLVSREQMLFARVTYEAKRLAVRRRVFLVDVSIVTIVLVLFSLHSNVPVDMAQVSAWTPVHNNVVPPTSKHAPTTTITRPTTSSPSPSSSSSSSWIRGIEQRLTHEPTRLMAVKRKREDDDDDTLDDNNKNNVNHGPVPSSSIGELISEDPRRTVVFSLLMILSGATLGPFLDSYHSAFGVLQYDQPITWNLWSSLSSSPSAPPALTTTWWVPGLFGLAGFIIGWLYIILDHIIIVSNNNNNQKNINIEDGEKIIDNSARRQQQQRQQQSHRLLNPSPPKILVGISFFTFQYWLSGTLVQYGVDRTTILNLMSVLAATGFVVLDGTLSGFYTSLATALGGPLIEVTLLTMTRAGMLYGTGYHYTDLGETGYFPLWIVPVYFLGGPANGNLARGFWNVLTTTSKTAAPAPSLLSSSKQLQEQERQSSKRRPCSVCMDTRRVECPNCEGVGTYIAMSERSVTCTSCRGKGFVICRSCFDKYDEDPYDIDQIRQFMDRMPD